MKSNIRRRRKFNRIKGRGRVYIFVPVLNKKEEKYSSWETLKELWRAILKSSLQERLMIFTLIISFWGIVIIGNYEDLIKPFVEGYQLLQDILNNTTEATNIRVRGEVRKEVKVMKEMMEEQVRQEVKHVVLKTCLCMVVSCVIAVGLGIL